jgi:hypothetical protein
MMQSNILTLILTIFLSTLLQSQVLTVDPAFPTIEDVVTITYDASQGNAALMGVSPIYSHMGLITSTSTSGTDWQFVQGNWGTADANVLMTSLGNNLHQIQIDIDVFYGFPMGTEVLQMAFVFRNAAGNIVGRAADGSDIFYDVYPVDAGLQVDFLTPSSDVIADENDILHIEAGSNTAAQLSLYDNGLLIASASAATFLSHDITVALPASHQLIVVADDGVTQNSDTIQYTVNGPVQVINPPGGMKDGVNYIDPNTVILQMHAPNKDFIYVIGDFNDWAANPNHYMHLADDLETWWVQIDDLTAGQLYAYQYWIEGDQKLADACSERILDPNNDSWISPLNYPSPFPYPTGQTSGFCSLIHPGTVAFNWQNDAYARPEKKDLRIYELHMRDFLHTKSYVTLLDTLDYLDDLGINAIEFMPVGEFENNDSWGYNPSFHMALDKFYGTPDMFKTVVDACHERGIAVIIDIALNHAYGQSPLVNMYWDSGANNVASDNPWFNQECPHPPFCWGYDFNHETDATKRYVDRVNRHWLEEYHVDGFRFDYTKGFTNQGSFDYDNTRIQLIERMADALWAIDSEAYVILEHWTGNQEEEILSDYGMMLWGNSNYNYSEAAMGYIPGSNFEWGIYLQRGWTDPHLVTFMESHDEERLSYRVKTYGNSNGSYDTQEYVTTYARHELAAVFFLSQPGPKMVWQFGELGYDISIDFICRVCAKPILWNYFEENPRKRLYDVYSAMNGLRENYPNTFNSSDMNYSLAGQFKRINLYNAAMDAVVIGNFGVTEVSGVPNFPYTGTWFDYFSGEAIVEDNLSNSFLLQPGEYRIYTSQQIEQPDLQSVGIQEQLLNLEVGIRPNPASDQLALDFELLTSGKLEVMILDAEGRIIRRLKNAEVGASQQYLTYDITGLSAGNYHVLIALDGLPNSYPFIKID